MIDVVVVAGLESKIAYNDLTTDKIKTSTANVLKYAYCIESWMESGIRCYDPSYPTHNLHDCHHVTSAHIAEI